MSINNGLALAQETIAFQPKDFGLELEAIVQEMLDSGLTAAKVDSQFSPQLSKTVKKYTNLNVFFTFNTTLEPSSLPFILTNGLILKNPSESARDGDTAKALIKFIQENKLVNRVNIKEAKVYGLFAELPGTIMFSWDIIKTFRLTKREVVAILLHEIGHIFTYFEYQNRFVTSNQVLSALLLSARDDSVEDYTFVYKAAAEVLTGNKNALDSLQQIKDSSLITAVVVDKTVHHFISQTNSPYNDSVSGEQLADAFCARFGYSRDLITGMEKVFTFAELGKKGQLRSSLYAVEVAGTVLAAGLTTLTAIVNPAVAASLCALYIASIFKISSTTGANSRDTYDDTRVRYLRIKEQVIEQIKDRKLPPKEIKKLVEDLRVIDEVIGQYADTPYTSLVTQAVNFIFRRHRNAADEVKLQRTLEELASNDLFVVSAKLNTLKSKKV